MNRKDYLLLQLRRTYNKPAENYAITRIVHRLSDPALKFVTQQYVMRPGQNGFALTDLYLPQIRVHIEVDERHHFLSHPGSSMRGLQEFSEDAEGNLHPLDGYVKLDSLRQGDIINATGHDVLRIKTVDCGLQELNRQIDEVVDDLRKRVHLARQSRDFQPWDPEVEYSPQRYIDQGEVDADRDVALRTHADVIECFGKKYKAYFRAFLKHPREHGVWIWFPKLYANSGWDNNISDDESTILERRVVDNEERLHGVAHEFAGQRRLVFAHVRSNLGDIMYRFKGVYEGAPAHVSITNGAMTYLRIAKRAKTYSPVEP